MAPSQHHKTTTRFLKKILAISYKLPLKDFDSMLQILCMVTSCLFLSLRLSLCL